MMSGYFLKGGVRGAWGAWGGDGWRTVHNWYGYKRFSMFIRSSPIQNSLAIIDYNYKF